MPPPLRGVRVLEIAGLAPVPLAGMILADFGAEVVRIDRVGAGFNPDVAAPNKKSVAINFKKPKGIELFKRLAKNADVVIEPFRPGVMEKLGIGPSVLRKDNPGLIFARLTGFGQTGPRSRMAGHDINYIAVAGALSLLGRADERPYAPINLLGDFAGGSLFCVLGVVLALFERQSSGKGQVIDAAMVDGASYLSSWIYLMRKAGAAFTAPRGTDMLDGGAPFYDTYETSDGKYMAVGAIEPQFYKILIEKLGLASDHSLPSQHDREVWPSLKQKFTAIFKSKTQDEWSKIFHGTDACVTPIVDFDEFVKETGYARPPPAPRLERTPALEPKSQEDSFLEIGKDTRDLLLEAGLSIDEIQKLAEDGVVEGLDLPDGVIKPKL